MEIGNLQFNYTADNESFKKASEEVKKRLKEQEIEVKKSEKSFLTFNKVVVASGVGLTALAFKKIPKVNAGFKAFAKGGGSVLTSLEKIALATKGVFGPFAKMGTAITGLTIGFETADLAMGALGVSTAGVIGSFVSMGGVLSGVLAVGLTTFISLAQGAADTLGNALLSKSREWLEVGAGLETQTFALNTSLKQYRDATGDASVTTESMVSLLNDLGQTTGLTRQQLKGGLTTMLNLSRVTGLTSDQIKVLIKRSADMSVALGADFNNVVQAIDQSFKGYNDRLLNFGVNITQATLAQTKFVSTQERTVDSLSSSQLVVAKYEDILDQTKNTGNSLARANNTLQGSALTLELAYESLQNRMGEATQEIFGPAIVSLNQMKTSFVNLAGKEGIAGVSAILVGFGGVLFKGIAFILKWGSVLVIASEIIKLLKFAVKGVSKVIGFFSGVLEFLSKITNEASIAMGKLALSTDLFAGAASSASLAANILAATSKGLGAGANISGKLAEDAGKKLSILTQGTKLFGKVLKPLFGVFGRLIITFFKWGSVLGLISAAVLLLVGVVKSLFKTFLSLIGVNVSGFAKSIKNTFESVKDTLINFAQFIVTIPQRIALSMELLTNNITVGVLSILKSVGLFTGKLEKTINNLKQRSIELREELSQLGKKDEADAKSTSSDRAFNKSKEFLKLEREAANRRLSAFNAEAGIVSRISDLSAKRNRITQDLQDIISPEIGKRKEILKITREQDKLLRTASKFSKEARDSVKAGNAGEKIKELRDLARGRDEAIRTANRNNESEELLNVLRKRRKDVTTQIATQEKIISDFKSTQIGKDKKIRELSLQRLKLEDEIAAIGKATPSQEEEVARLRKERIGIDEDLIALEAQKKSIGRELTDIKDSEIKLIELQSSLEQVQGKNRLSALSIEREILQVEQERLKNALSAAQADAKSSGGLGKLEVAKFELDILRLKKQELSLLIKEKALRRSIIDELGPLNAQFQQARIEDIQNLQSELIKAKVSSQEIIRVTSEQIRNEQIAIWNRIIERSNDSLLTLQGKLVLYFDSTRDLAKQTAEVMFDVFTSLEDALSSTISNIANGISDIKDGFKDFRDAIINIVISALVQLGIQQIKGFLVQESGILGSIKGLQAEGGAVGVLTSQYTKLAVAKSTAASTGGAGNVGSAGGAGGLIGPTLQGGNFFSNGSGGAAGPLLPNGQFVSGASGGSFAGAAGAAGLGAVGGGLLGSAIGGAEGGKAGAIGGAIGAGLGTLTGIPGAGIVGGILGSAIGGLFGRGKRRRAKRAKKAAKQAKKEIDDLAGAIEDGTVNLDVALVQVSEKIKKSTKQAREAWLAFRKELDRQRKAVKKELIEVAKSLDARITLFKTNKIIRGTVGELQGLRKEMDDLRKDFEKLPSAVGSSTAKINTLFTESIKAMIEELDQLVKDQVKSFEKGARDDAGNLISVAKRANLDITKLFEQRKKLTKDFAKSIKDIENEGIAQRQKTIQKDKEERITELTKQFNTSKLGLDNQISTIRIVTSERSAANAKALAELEAQRVAIESTKAAEKSRAAQELADLQKKLDLLKARRAFLLAERGRAEQGIADISSQALPSPLFDKSPTGTPIARFEGAQDAFLANRDRNIQILSDTVTKRDSQLVATNLQFTTLVQTLQALQANQPTFGSGGPVLQTGLANVHQGEFVVQEKFASRLTPLLESLNKGQIPTLKSSGGFGGGSVDLSIRLSVGSVDSAQRVRDIEGIVKNLQQKQLFRVRQVTGV